MSKKIFTSITLGSSVALAAMAGAATANANPFDAKTLAEGGYQVAMLGDKHKEGKCGEGKCGDKKAEAKCGEAKCGAKDKKDAEGKCGEGKCGEKMEKKAEGKCGEGKCGG